MKCAVVSGKLGAGRTKAGEAISPDVGLTLSVQIGDKIEEGS
jgi:thymidine phosphorylase